MSFDSSTRSVLAKLVGESRKLLMADLLDQINRIYQIPVDGLAPPDTAGLSHLDEQGKAIAQALREWQDHLVAGETGNTKQCRHAAAKRMGNEAAFTQLNRLAALRLCEERGHVVECVRRGLYSDGFQLYERMANGALGDRDQTYRAFLDSMFDEMASDMGSLFDRRLPQSLVAPSAVCLENVLNLLNDPDLAAIWQQDETIGWIYQYYNDPAERKKMRDESAAPRNSHELAVRNQFFTPRYVVEFLTDNTLGRIWYEMNEGKTRLKDQCCYLVRRPKEIFLRHDEAATEQAQQDNESQYQFLQEPVLVPHRPLKDPREIRMLDPACGSMHFGLYAFDLLEVIYDEAWEIANSNNDERKSSGTFKHFVSFAVQYPDKTAFLVDLPRLIIEHNLHGIDIDPRAAQIAAFSLWLRAQRSWQQLGLRSQSRPRIRRSNIVCAEPMPGEAAFLDEFIETHLAATPERKLLGQLVRRAFDGMKLAGEAGSLLRIEEEIASAVIEAKNKWLSGPKLHQSRLFDDDPGPPIQQQLDFDVTGITDEAFWEKAEERIYAALQAYAERAEHCGYQRHLFADDAARGFAFIDLCRQRYDVVLMNPPFGEPTSGSKDYVEGTAGAAKADIYTAFIYRWCKSLAVGGREGAITPRSFIYQVDFHVFRKLELLPHLGLPLLIELGLGELDGATNRTAAFIITPSRPPRETSLYATIADAEDKGQILKELICDLSNPGWQSACITDFDLPSSSQLLFRLSSSFRALLSRIPRLDPVLGKSQKGIRDGVATVANGLQCPSDFRYVRLRVEAPTDGIGGTWLPFLKPIHFAPYISEIACVVNWNHGGKEQKAEFKERGISPSKYISGEAFYPSLGAWFPDVSERGIGACLIPFPTIPGRKGLLALGKSAAVPSDALAGFLNSIIAEGVLGLTTPERHHKPSYVGQIPWLDDPECIALASRHYWRMVEMASAEAPSELSPEFVAPDLLLHEGSSLSESIQKVRTACQLALEGLEEEQHSFDCSLLDRLGAGNADRLLLNEMSNRAAVAEWFPVSFSLTESTECSLLESLMSFLVGSAFGRWNVFAGLENDTRVLRIRARQTMLRCPPGQLQNELDLPITRQNAEGLKEQGLWNCPIEIPWGGILVDDSGHPEDIEARVQHVLNVLWKDRWENIEREACEILGVKGLRDYFRKPTGFFGDHLKRYSKSGRQAPIYWPLSSGSGRYTLWVYYASLSADTLYQAVNDFVDPKIRDVERHLADIETQLPRTSGRDSARLRDLFEQDQFLRDELTDFKAELLRVASLPYSPNLNDGVLISAAPLWKLFRLPKWRKALQECWEELEALKYPWAHISLAVWPDKVKEVCRTDLSVAIAHDMTDLYEGKK